MRRTSLFPIHKELDAKIVEFAGWEMPVQYEGVRAEHCVVRRQAGLFDISHMGEIEVTGKEAARFCQLVTTNDLGRLDNFQAQYTLFCNFRGGVVDDVILYRFSDERLLFCVNASNRTQVLEWLKGLSHMCDVEITDRSHEFAQVAIQGPASEPILSKTVGEDLGVLQSFSFRSLNWSGKDLTISRTGYTGEDGFEIFLPWQDGQNLWTELTTVGKQYGLKPCGLGARDTLRIEMGYSLYGHEINERVSPFDAGLGKYVKMYKEDFIGKEALQDALSKGSKNKVVGFEMIARGIPRQGYDILKNGVSLGKVTSGTLSPTLDKSIGIGYLNKEVEHGGRIEIWIRGTAREALVVDLPFYKRQGRASIKTQSIKN